MKKLLALVFAVKAAEDGVAPVTEECNGSNYPCVIDYTEDLLKKELKDNTDYKIVVINEDGGAT